MGGSAWRKVWAPRSRVPAGWLPDRNLGEDMMVVAPHAGSRRRISTLVMFLLAPLLAVLWPDAAHAAVAKPTGLRSQSAVTAVVVSWTPVRGAASYRVQLASSSSFDDPVMDVETANTYATPTAVVPFGRVYWRVSAGRDRKWSAWSSASFTRTQRDGPILTEPEDGAELDQPEHPPVLRWDSVPGAVKYVVEIDGEERDWVDTETYETETTSLVPTETQQPGTYWWRVRTFFDREVNSLPSAARSYTIGPLPSVELTETAPTMEDVVLQWDPVPGAVDYEVRVSTDNGFNVITDRQFVSGTRYSPPTTYDNASYWWQVRARDVFGQSEEWPVYPERTGVFQRTWPDRPELVSPTVGSTASGEVTFQWTPAQHAAWYLLDVGTDPGFSSSRSFETCDTTQTTYTPGWWRGRSIRPDGCMPTTAGTYYWRVRAIDANTSTSATKTVNGRFSAVGSFTWAGRAEPSGTLQPAAGQRVLLEGNGTSGCAGSLTGGGVCAGVTSTPVLDWDPAPGAAYYLLYLAHDRNFTNMVKGYGDIGDPDSLVHTMNTRFAPMTALPDTQAGEAYYWFVRPCDRSGRCGLTPEEASNAFQKKSVPVQLTSPAAGATLADQATFTWTDYLATNQDTTDPATGEHPTQAARSYRIQVSQNPSFVRTKAEEVYEVVVDQTTFTTFAHSYPEGVLYWRVQAIDGYGNGLTWSPIRQFTKASPAPEVVAPTDGQSVDGVQPFRWRPLPFSKYYDLEVYRNSDTTASSANLAAWARNIRQAAFTAKKPLQALGQDFVWRVRRSDYDGHKGAWSSWHRFRVTAKAPQLLSPGSRVVKNRAVFSWRAIAQAAEYRWELRRGSALVQSTATTATSYAPTRALTRGRHTWRVVSYDSDRHVLKATGWRRVAVR